ncbi:MAG: hypothetical protein WC584_04145 [Candidatus Pacearchaeota archaeon]
MNSKYKILGGFWIILSFVLTIILFLSILNHLFRWGLLFLGTFQVMFFDWIGGSSSYWEDIGGFILTLIIFFVLFFIGKVYLKVGSDDLHKNKIISFSFWLSITAIILSLILIFLALSGPPDSYLWIYLIPFVFGFFILVSFILLVINWFKDRNK